MRSHRDRRSLRRDGARACAALTAASIAVVPALVVAPTALAGLSPQDSAAGPSPVAAVAPTAARASAHTSPDLDVLFIGAHPDDEAFRLATYGQWHEYDDVTTGVVTITRGEGGGNAVGPEEGPALGLIREAEERRAVSRAGITDVYNLDQVDFYYTVSAPLTEDVWGREDTLDRVVRIIRETKPEVIVTMDPAPSPGNHGNHQYAGRMALEGYNLAGDRTAFPGQITDEGLRPFAPKKLFLHSARGTGSPGPNCPTTFVPQRPTQNIYGIWTGRQSEVWETTWAQVARESQREYASQGWSVFPDVPTDPNMLGCDFFAQVEARVPFVRGDLSAAAADPTTALQGAVRPTPGGFPLGTGLDVSAEPFSVTPGGSTEVTVKVTAPKTRSLHRVQLTLELPSGWTSSGNGNIWQLKAGRSATRVFQVTAASDATANQRVLASVEMSARSGMQGHGDVELEVVPLVRGDQELLPQVLDFQQYAQSTGYPQMEGFVKPVLTLPSGGSREIDVTLTNFSDAVQAGDVSMQLPAGFAAEPASASYAGLAPGATTTATFTVTNTDASLPTSNQGGVGGDYDYSIVTTAGSTTSTTKPALELVPTTDIEAASAAPSVDGMVSAGEYAGEPIDLSRVWEGTPCDSAADCSATGHVTRNGDDLFFAVEVTDDVLGTVLDTSDCKRHWRTDSVEIAIDPDGTSENTSTTFKALVLPTTTEGEPCYGRDADNHQGGPETAPTMEVASTVSSPFSGYVVEAKIPAAELPSTVDPQHMGLNVFIYDSDTQDKTGQTRIGWSTWGGVQGDPYRWGLAALPGWTPPAIPTAEPIIPSVALLSVDSPQTIAQAVRNGVAVAGGPEAAPGTSAFLTRAVGFPARVSARVLVQGPGEAHAFAVSGDDEVLGSTVKVLRPGVRWVRIPVSGPVPDGSRVLMAYAANAGGTTSSAAAVE